MGIAGKMILNVRTPYSKKKFVIGKDTSYAILVPPKYWCSVKFINKESILMVMNDRYYEFNDYLETFNEYRKYLLKK